MNPAATVPAPIRALLADDHLIVRQGLKQVLGDPANGPPEIAVLAEAASGPEALAQVEALQGPAGLDLVLLDIAMPGLDGLEVLQQLRRQWPALPVLMLSTYPEKQYAVRCIKLGAAGYLNKSADPDDMVAAVRKVAAGGRYLSEATAEALAGALSRTTLAPSTPAAVMAAIDALSHREHQVPFGERNWCTAQARAQHREHLPGAHPRKDRGAQRCRAGLAGAQRLGRLKTGPAALDL